MWEKVKTATNQINTFVRERKSLVSGVLAGLILIGWTVFVLGFVFAHGVCCADDANGVLLAKEFSEGYTHIYDSPLGPAFPIILIAAGLIKYFGPTYWVPGLSVVILNGLLILVIGILLSRESRNFSLPLATGVFFTLNYVLMAYHFEQWYAFLGEIPAALFIVLGVVLFFYKNSIIYPFLGGFSLSLAFLTKFVAGIGFLGLFFAALLLWISQLVRFPKADRRVTILKILGLSIGFLIPFGIFWGFWYLSSEVQSYQQILAEFLPYIADHTLDQSVYNIKRIPPRLGIIRERFGAPLFLLLAALGLSGYLIRKKKKIQSIHYGLFSIVIIYSVYWVFFSIARPRHFVVPLLLIVLALALPFLAIDEKKWFFTYTGVIVLVFAFTLPRLGYSLSTLDKGLYNPTFRTQALRATTDLLVEAGEEELILTQKNYAANDIQFLSDEELNIQTFSPRGNYKTPFWIAVNTKFMHQQDPAFMRLLRNCSGLEEYEGYLVGRCE